MGHYKGLAGVNKGERDGGAEGLRCLRRRSLSWKWDIPFIMLGIFSFVMATAAGVAGRWNSLGTLPGGFLSGAAVVISISYMVPIMRWFSNTTRMIVRRSVLIVAIVVLHWVFSMLTNFALYLHQQTLSENEKESMAFFANRGMMKEASPRAWP